MKIHLAVTESRGDTRWTGTLCGRESGKSQDGANAEPDKAKVSCRFCLKIMSDPHHWRHRRFMPPIGPCTLEQLMNMTQRHIGDRGLVSITPCSSYGSFFQILVKRTICRTSRSWMSEAISNNANHIQVEESIFKLKHSIDTHP
jgi:hypothetical protein